MFLLVLDPTMTVERLPTMTQTLYPSPQPGSPGWHGGKQDGQGWTLEDIPEAAPGRGLLWTDNPDDDDPEDEATE